MRRKRIIIGTAATILALAIAAPVAANEAVRWTDGHKISNVFSCGVVEDTTATINGTAYFDADGSWIKDILRFSYEASFTDPDTGTTLSYKTHQIVMADPGSISLVAQGAFVRTQGGVALIDVGRLVFDPGDGSTIFKSAKTLAFDDPNVFDRYDAAICGLF